MQNKQRLKCRESYYCSLLKKTALSGDSNCLELVMGSFVLLYYHFATTVVDHGLFRVLWLNMTLTLVIWLVGLAINVESSLALDNFKQPIAINHNWVMVHYHST